VILEEESENLEGFVTDNLEYLEKLFNFNVTGRSAGW